MDFGYALTALTTATARGGSPLSSSSSRIMAYNNCRKDDLHSSSSLLLSRRGLVKTMTSTGRVLDAPGLKDDATLNLIHWGDQLAVALGGILHYFDPSPSSLTIHDIDAGDVISCLKWAPDGRHIAIGLNECIQLWDVRCHRLLRTLADSLGSSRVHSMSWNGNILSSGGSDGTLVISDPRLKSSPAVVVYGPGHRRHRRQIRMETICGLSWSNAGQQLASGCSDGLVHIWDARSQAKRSPWVHSFTTHHHGGVAAAARALSWCPFKDSLLATGGGGGCIQFWSTRTGTCTNTLRTGSSGPVLGLVWGKTKQQLLSSSSSAGSGSAMTIWDYPSMAKTTNLVGHTHRVMYLAQSPDGRRIASAAGGTDETIRSWDAFPSMPPEEAATIEPFTSSYHTQIR